MAEKIRLENLQAERVALGQDEEKVLI